MTDDYFVEDLMKSLEGREKKRPNSGRIGKGGERELAKLFTERFGESFFRVVGSGNRWSQVSLTEQAKAVFSGDIVCPEWFRFVVECKFGYEDVELAQCLAGNCRVIDEFLSQADRAAGESGREPMLCWRKRRQPWVAFVRDSRAACDRLHYRGWVAVSLGELLKNGNDFFHRPA